jgi:alpha-maltose-1-phosphate synthase
MARILIVSIGHPYYTSELSGVLAQAGHEVKVLMDEDMPDFVGTGSADRKAEYRQVLDPKVEIEWVKIPDNTTLGTAAANLRSIFRMKRIIRRYRPDIIHAHDVADYRMYGALAMAGRIAPLVLTVHDAQLHPGYGGNRWQFLIPKLRRRANAIIVHGEDIRKRLVAIDSSLGSKTSIIPHGAYTLYRKWMTNEVSSDGKHVLVFGRIVEYKGVDYLIKAAPIVQKQIPGVKFVIAGSGDDWPRCKALIEDPALFDLHEGNVSDSDAVRLFQQSSVVVLPYVEASQSGVLTMAYAMEKPVIVTNVGSLPEVVDDGVTGLIVPPRDVEALAGAIVRVLGDSEFARTMGANAFARASTGDLSWKLVATKTGELYERLLKGEPEAVIIEKRSL